MVATTTKAMRFNDPFLEQVALSFERGAFQTRKEAHQVYLKITSKNGFDKAVQYSRFCEKLSVILNYTKMFKAKVGAKSARKDNFMVSGFYEVNSPHSELQIDAQAQPIMLRHPLCESKRYRNDFIYNTKCYTALNSFHRYPQGSVFTLAKGEAAGYYVEALKRALLPSRDMKSLYGCKHENIAYGAVELVRSDRGAALTNHQLSKFMDFLRMDVVIGAGGAAQQNGLIEWYHGHRQKSFLRHLPGYYLNSAGQSQAAVGEAMKRAKQNAALTPFEFEVLHYRFENDVYAQTSLRGSPSPYEQVVSINQSADNPPTIPSCSADAIRSYAIELPEKGTVQKNKGIEYARRFYNSTQLRELYYSMTAKGGSRKVDFMFDPVDRKCIIVQVPKSLGGGSIKVPMARQVKKESEVAIEDLMHSELRDEALDKLKHMSSEEIVAKAEERRNSIRREISAEKSCRVKPSAVTDLNASIFDTAYDEPQYTQTDKYHQGIDHTPKENELISCDSAGESNEDSEEVEVG